MLQTQVLIPIPHVLPSCTIISHYHGSNHIFDCGYYYNRFLDGLHASIIAISLSILHLESRVVLLKG